MAKSLVAVVREAIIDYAQFENEEVEQAVLDALTKLDAGLNEAGYEQSSPEEQALQKIEEAMNVADGTRQAKGGEGGEGED